MLSPDMESNNSLAPSQNVMWEKSQFDCFVWHTIKFVVFIDVQEVWDMIVDSHETSHKMIDSSKRGEWYVFACNKNLK